MMASLADDLSEIGIRMGIAFTVDGEPRPLTGLFFSLFQTLQ
jgi:hypothetical protein